MRFLSKIFLSLLILTMVQTTQAEWVKQDLKTFAWLRSIHFVDAETGWISGSGGTLFKTIDGGKTWKQNKKFTEDSIRDVFFSDKNTGWILCERNIYSLGTKAPSYLMKTTDGGNTWDRIEFSNRQKQRITKIFFADSGFGLAIGETGALFGLEDNNRTWKKLAAPSGYLMLDGIFTDNLNGTIVGGGGTILFTEDAGASWNQAYIADTNKVKLNSVHFANKRNGWVAGSKGKIYHTFNGGKFWRLQNSKTDKNLNDVFFLNTAEGWAVGDDGTILYSKSAGNVWEKMDSKSIHKLEKIYFKGEKGWIVGFGGTLLSFEKGRKSFGNRPKFRNR